MEESNLMETFLGILGQLKVFHWATMSFSKHKALDDLHGAFGELVDRFIEVYIGKFKKQPIKSFKITMHAHSDVSKLDKYLETEREALRKIHTQCVKTTELQNIVDEMMAEFNKAIYLCNLS